ncbi:hypothetical protein ABFA07_019761 [Porites harrisoni]
MVPRFGREKNCRDAITQRPFYQSLQRFQDKEYSTTMCLNWESQCCVVDDGGSFMSLQKPVLPPKIRTIKTI